MEYFTIVLQQIFMFVIYIIVGIIAVKTKLIDEKGLGYLSRLILRIIIPIMLFTNTINGATRSEFIADLPVMALTVLMYALLYVVSLLLAKIFRMKGDTGNVYRGCTMFGNIGFIGIPIIAALFPEQGMLYIALFTVVDQLILWTIGKQLTTPGNETAGLTPAQLAMKMVNPSTVAILLSVVFVLADWHLPTLMNTALSNIGGLTSVLAMIYMGGLFCYTDIIGYVKKIEIYGEVIVKMLLTPVLFDAILRLLPGITQEIRITMCILIALPTMTTIALFANDQKSDGKYAAGMVFMTHVFSLVTLPLICLWIGR